MILCERTLINVAKCDYGQGSVRILLDKLSALPRPPSWF